MMPEALFARDATPENLSQLLEPLLLPDSPERRHQVIYCYYIGTNKCNREEPMNYVPMFHYISYVIANSHL